MDEENKEVEEEKEEEKEEEAEEEKEEETDDGNSDETEDGEKKNKLTPLELKIQRRKEARERRNRKV